MKVMDKLQEKLVSGITLLTPVQKKPFSVGDISDTGVTLIIGERRSKTSIDADCWNGIPNFIKDKDWVGIGSKHSTKDVKPGTLEAYLDDVRHKNSAGSYVASVLEHVGIVQICRKIPSSIKFIPSSLK